MKSKVGISEISVVIPNYFIGTEKISKVQDLPLSYIVSGLGVKQSRTSYNTALEDLIVKAVKKIKYKDAGRFIVASESDGDLSKASISIKSINKKLNLKTVPFQLKFACLAGVQALLSACDYVVSHEKPAVVITADRSFYKKNKAGATQGTGVVAIRIENKPQLLEIDFQRYGEYAEDINDFKVPARMAPFPKIDGQLTKPAFMKCILYSLKDYKKKKLKKESVTKNMDYFVMHSPFPKIVMWVAAALWRFENYDNNKNFCNLLEKSIEKPKLFNKFKKLFDKVRKLDDFQDFYKKKVEQSLIYNPYIGNCYTASIFISLISTLEKAQKNEKICLIGYGSGAGSLALEGVAQKSDFKSDLKEQIEQGKELTLSQYQEWRKNTIRRIRKG